MRNHRYYPRATPAQVLWLRNFADKLPALAAQLGLTESLVAAALADCGFMGYILSSWISGIRAYGMAATATLSYAGYGQGANPVALPVLTVPELPKDATPVWPGALNRIFALVRKLKLAKSYTKTIGLDLGVEAPGNFAAHPVPTLKLTVVAGIKNQAARLGFVKFGHHGVLIESRTNGGPWQKLGTYTRSPFLDTRPLLVAGIAEVREYRIRFIDMDVPTGEWSGVAKIAIGP